MIDFKTFDALCSKRGTLKEWMGLRRIRTINYWNYLTWKGYSPEKFPVKTIKLDILNGYLNMFDGNNKKISSEIANSLYDKVFDMTMEIFKNEKLIPYKQRKNIVVKVNR